MVKNINNTVSTNYYDVADHSLDLVNVDAVQEQDETRYVNDRWRTDWSYFMRIPKLYSAITMKGIWLVGKGLTTADSITQTRIDYIKGNGKETFLDILYNMCVCALVGRDSYAEIVWNDPVKRDYPINLKVLDPGSITKVFGKDGIIKRYEQMSRTKGKGNYIKFDPRDIFTLSNNCLAGSMHGTSVPEIVEKIILADDENFNIMKKLTRFQAVPFVIFKVKSDNASTIATFKANIKESREKGEDLIIPDDDNLLSWEVVQVSPAPILMEWRNSINNQFYQAVGMPLILFGGAGTTESGGKIEYTGHEQVWQFGQGYVERQVRSQLHLEINLISPQSLLNDLQADEGKDAQNALSFQPNDAQAGVGA